MSLTICHRLGICVKLSSYVDFSRCRYFRSCQPIRRSSTSPFFFAVRQRYLYIYISKLKLESRTLELFIRRKLSDIIKGFTSFILLLILAGSSLSSLGLLSMQPAAPDKAQHNVQLTFEQHVRDGLCPLWANAALAQCTTAVLRSAERHARLSRPTTGDATASRNERRGPELGPYYVPSPRWSTPFLSLQRPSFASKMTTDEDEDGALVRRVAVCSPPPIKRSWPAAAPPPHPMPPTRPAFRSAPACGAERGAAAPSPKPAVAPSALAATDSITHGEMGGSATRLPHLSPECGLGSPPPSRSPLTPLTIEVPQLPSKPPGAAALPSHVTASRHSARLPSIQMFQFPGSSAPSSPVLSDNSPVSPVALAVAAFYLGLSTQRLASAFAVVEHAAALAVPSSLGEDGEQEDPTLAEVCQLLRRALETWRRLQGCLPSTRLSDYLAGGGGHGSDAAVALAADLLRQVEDLYLLCERGLDFQSLPENPEAARITRLSRMFGEKTPEKMRTRFDVVQSCRGGRMEWISSDGDLEDALVALEGTAPSLHRFSAPLCRRLFTRHFAVQERPSTGRPQGSEGWRSLRGGSVPRSLDFIGDELSDPLSTPPNARSSFPNPFRVSSRASTVPCCPCDSDMRASLALLAVPFIMLIVEVDPAPSPPQDWKRYPQEGPIESTFCVSVLASPIIPPRANSTINSPTEKDDTTAESHLAAASSSIRTSPPPTLPQSLLGANFSPPPDPLSNAINAFPANDEHTPNGVDNPSISEITSKMPSIGSPANAKNTAEPRFPSAPSLMCPTPQLSSCAVLPYCHISATLDSMNKSAEWLLGLREGEGLSRFRFFAPVEGGSGDTEEACGSVAWFHAIAAALPQQDRPAAAVEWLRAHAGLDEVLVTRHPGDEKEDLLAAVARCAASPGCSDASVAPWLGVPCAGAPLVVHDASTGAFYGVDAYTWRTAHVVSEGGFQQHRVALLFRYVLASGSRISKYSAVSPTSCSPSRSPLSAMKKSDLRIEVVGTTAKEVKILLEACPPQYGEIISGPPSFQRSLLYERMFSPMLSRSAASAVDSYCKSGTEQPSKYTSVLTGSADAPLSVSTLEKRGNEVNVLRLPALLQRLESQCLLPSICAGHTCVVPEEFYVHDLLLLLAVQQFLQFQDRHLDHEGQEEAFCTLLSRCESHLVLDILPKAVVPSSAEGLRGYMDRVEDYYASQQAAHASLFAYCGPDVFAGRIEEQTNSWASRVRSCCLLQTAASTSATSTSAAAVRECLSSPMARVISHSSPPSPHQRQSYRSSTQPARGSHQDARQSGSMMSAKDPSFVSRSETTHSGLRPSESSSTNITINGVPPPPVWAVEMNEEASKRAVLHPHTFLSDEVREMLISVGAAVVVTGSGAATIAFPFITQDRLDLLREMELVQQPLAVMADLGIVAVNQMADYAALKKTALEATKNVEIADLHYGTMPDTFSQALRRDFYIPTVEELQEAYRPGSSRLNEEAQAAEEPSWLATKRYSTPAPESETLVLRTVSHLSEPQEGTARSVGSPSSVAVADTVMHSSGFTQAFDTEGGEPQLERSSVSNSEPWQRLGSGTLGLGFATALPIPILNNDKDKKKRWEPKENSSTTSKRAEEKHPSRGERSSSAPHAEKVAAAPTKLRCSPLPLGLRSTTLFEVSPSTARTDGAAPSSPQEAPLPFCDSLAGPPSSAAPQEVLEEMSGTDFCSYDMQAYPTLHSDSNMSFVDYASLPQKSTSSSNLSVPRLDSPFMSHLIFHWRPCNSLLKWLISLNNSITHVSSPLQIAGFLRYNLSLYDVVIIEWDKAIMTPENISLLETAVANNFSVPIFYCVLAGPPKDANATTSDGTQDSSSSYLLNAPLPPHCPPLPRDVNPTFVLRGTDLQDATLTHRSMIRRHIRMGRILKDLRGDHSMIYQITRRIGSGGFGDVYEVSLYASKGRLAMKRIPLGVITVDRMECLHKEVAIMREMDHRNIVQLSHVTCDKTCLNIFMELCECTLEDIMEDGLMDVSSRPSPDLPRHSPTPGSPTLSRNNDHLHISSALVRRSRISDMPFAVVKTYKRAQDVAQREQSEPVSSSATPTVAGMRASTFASPFSSRRSSRVEELLTALHSSPSGFQISCSGATRTIFAIEIDSRSLTCRVSQHQLPASLIELFESTFHRNPEKRITAELLLEHPIANDRGWVHRMLMEVHQLNVHIGTECKKGAADEVIKKGGGEESLSEMIKFTSVRYLSFFVAVVRTILLHCTASFSAYDAHAFMRYVVMCIDGYLTLILLVLFSDAFITVLVFYCPIYIILRITAFSNNISYSCLCGFLFLGEGFKASIMQSISPIIMSGTLFVDVSSHMLSLKLLHQRCLTLCVFIFYYDYYSYPFFCVVTYFSSIAVNSFPSLLLPSLSQSFLPFGFGCLAWFLTAFYFFVGFHFSIIIIIIHSSKRISISTRTCTTWLIAIFCAAVLLPLPSLCLAGSIIKTSSLSEPGIRINIKKSEEHWMVAATTSFCKLWGNAAALFCALQHLSEDSASTPLRGGDSTRWTLPPDPSKSSNSGSEPAVFRLAMPAGKLLNLPLAVSGTTVGPLPTTNRHSCADTNGIAASSFPVSSHHPSSVPPAIAANTTPNSSAPISVQWLDERPLPTPAQKKKKRAARQLRLLYAHTLLSARRALSQHFGILDRSGCLQRMTEGSDSSAVACEQLRGAAEMWRRLQGCLPSTRLSDYLAGGGGHGSDAAVALAADLLRQVEDLYLLCDSKPDLAATQSDPEMARRARLSRMFGESLERMQARFELLQHPEHLIGVSMGDVEDQLVALQATAPTTNSFSPVLCTTVFGEPAPSVDLFYETPRGSSATSGGMLRRFSSAFTGPCDSQNGDLTRRLMHALAAPLSHPLAVYRVPPPSPLQLVPAPEDQPKSLSPTAGVDVLSMLTIPFVTLCVGGSAECYSACHEVTQNTYEEHGLTRMSQRRPSLHISDGDSNDVVAALPVEASVTPTGRRGVLSTCTSSGGDKSLISYRNGSGAAGKATHPSPKESEAQQQPSQSATEGDAGGAAAVRHHSVDGFTANVEWSATSSSVVRHVMGNAPSRMAGDIAGLHLTLHRDDSSSSGGQKTKNSNATPLQSGSLLEVASGAVPYEKVDPQQTCLSTAKAVVLSSVATSASNSCTGDENARDLLPPPLGCANMASSQPIMGHTPSPVKPSCLPLAKVCLPLAVSGTSDTAKEASPSSTIPSSLLGTSPPVVESYNAAAEVLLGLHPSDDLSRFRFFAPMHHAITTTSEETGSVGWYHEIATALVKISPLHTDGPTTAVEWLRIHAGLGEVPVAKYAEDHDEDLVTAVWRCASSPSASASGAPWPDMACAGASLVVLDTAARAFYGVDAYVWNVSETMEGNRQLQQHRVALLFRYVLFSGKRLLHYKEYPKQLEREQLPSVRATTFNTSSVMHPAPPTPPSKSPRPSDARSPRTKWLKNRVRSEDRSGTTAVQSETGTPPPEHVEPADVAAAEPAGETKKSTEGVEELVLSFAGNNNLRVRGLPAPPRKRLLPLCAATSTTSSDHPIGGVSPRSASERSMQSMDDAAAGMVLSPTRQQERQKLTPVMSETGTHNSLAAPSGLPLQSPMSLPAARAEVSSPGAMSVTPPTSFCGSNVCLTTVRSALDGDAADQTGSGSKRTNGTPIPIAGKGSSSLTGSFCTSSNRMHPRPSPIRVRDEEPMLTRATEVSDVKTSLLQKRLLLQNGIVCVKIANGIHSEVFLNDTLMLLILQCIMAHQDHSRRESDGVKPVFLAYLNVCESHFVIDLLPMDYLPSEKDDLEAYLNTIHEFYKDLEARHAQLFASAPPSLFADRREATMPKWVEGVVNKCMLQPPSNSSVRLHVDNSFADHLLRASFSVDPNLNRSYVYHSSSQSLSMTNDYATSGMGDGQAVISSPAPITEDVLPEVWAVHVGSSVAEKTMIHPKWYLSDTIRNMMVAIGAAVVLTGSGAATMAFPFITQAKLDLLKRMRIVHHPLAVMADLGIVAVNQMAEDALIVMRTQQGKKKEGGIVQLDYGCVAATFKKALEKSVRIASSEVMKTSNSSAPSKITAVDSKDSSFDENAGAYGLGGAMLSEALGVEELLMHSKGPVPSSEKKSLLAFAKPIDVHDEEEEDTSPTVNPPPDCRRTVYPTSGAKSRTFIYESTTRVQKVVDASVDPVASGGISSNTPTCTGFLSSTATPHARQLASVSRTPENLTLEVVPHSSSSSRSRYDTRRHLTMQGEAEVSFIDYLALPQKTNTNPERIDFPDCRALVLYSTPCYPFLQWLISIGHGLTYMNNAAQIAGAFQCQLDMYEFIFIEWAAEIMTPKNIELLTEALKNNFSTPVFFCVIGPHVQLDAAYPEGFPSDLPPLPAGIPHSHVFYALDMNDAILLNRPFIRREVRLGRILKSLRGNDDFLYQVTRLIGSGGFGDVYEIVFYASKGRLAMKRIPLGVITLERMEYLFKEVAIMREMDHRNIVQISHVSCDKTFLNIFMELCDFTLMDLFNGGLQEMEVRNADLHTTHPAQEGRGILHNTWWDTSPLHHHSSQRRYQQNVQAALQAAMRLATEERQLPHEEAWRQGSHSQGSQGTTGSSQGTNSGSRLMSSTEARLKTYSGSSRGTGSSYQTTRTIFAIELDNRNLSCTVSEHKLPSSLIELFETIFHRSAEKRITAEKLLEHPIANDRGWVQQMFVAVHQLNIRIGTVARGKEEADGRGMDMSMSVSKDGSGDDTLTAFNFTFVISIICLCVLFILIFPFHSYLGCGSRRITDLSIATLYTASIACFTELWRIEHGRSSSCVITTREKTNQQEKLAVCGYLMSNAMRVHCLLILHSAQGIVQRSLVSSPSSLFPHRNYSTRRYCTILFVNGDSGKTFLFIVFLCFALHSPALYVRLHTSISSGLTLCACGPARREYASRAIKEKEQQAREFVAECRHPSMHHSPAAGSLAAQDPKNSDMLYSVMPETAAPTTASNMSLSSTSSRGSDDGHRPTSNRLFNSVKYDNSSPPRLVEAKSRDMSFVTVITDAASTPQILSNPAPSKTNDQISAVPSPSRASSYITSVAAPDAASNPSTPVGDNAFLADIPKNFPADPDLEAAGTDTSSLCSDTAVLTAHYFQDAYANLGEHFSVLQRLDAVTLRMLGTDPVAEAGRLLRGALYTWRQLQGYLPSSRLSEYLSGKCSHDSDMALEMAVDLRHQIEDLYLLCDAVQETALPEGMKEGSEEAKQHRRQRLSRIFGETMEDMQVRWDLLLSCSTGRPEAAKEATPSDVEGVLLSLQETAPSNSSFSPVLRAAVFAEPETATEVCRGVARAARGMLRRFSTVIGQACDATDGDPTRRLLHALAAPLAHPLAFYRPPPQSPVPSSNNTGSVSERGQSHSFGSADTWDRVEMREQPVLALLSMPFIILSPWASSVDMAPYWMNTLDNDKDTDLVIPCSETPLVLYDDKGQYTNQGSDSFDKASIQSPTQSTQMRVESMKSERISAFSINSTSKSIGGAPSRIHNFNTADLIDLVYTSSKNYCVIPTVSPIATPTGKSPHGIPPGDTATSFTMPYDHSGSPPHHTTLPSVSTQSQTVIPLPTDQRDQLNLYLYGVDINSGTLSATEMTRTLPLGKSETLEKDESTTMKALPNPSTTASPGIAMVENSNAAAERLLELREREDLGRFRFFALSPEGGGVSLEESGSESWFHEIAVALPTMLEPPQDDPSAAVEWLRTQVAMTQVAVTKRASETSEDLLSAVWRSARVPSLCLPIPWPDVPMASAPLVVHDTVTNAFYGVDAYAWVVREEDSDRHPQLHRIAMIFRYVLYQGHKEKLVQLSLDPKDRRQTSRVPSRPRSLPGGGSKRGADPRSRRLSSTEAEKILEKASTETAKLPIIPKEKDIPSRDNKDASAPPTTTAVAAAAGPSINSSTAHILSPATTQDNYGLFPNLSPVPIWSGAESFITDPSVSPANLLCVGSTVIRTPASSFPSLPFRPSSEARRTIQTDSIPAPPQEKSNRHYGPTQGLPRTPAAPLWGGNDNSETSFCKSSNKPRSHTCVTRESLSAECVLNFSTLAERGLEINDIKIDILKMRLLLLNGIESVDVDENVTCDVLVNDLLMLMVVQQIIMQQERCHESWVSYAVFLTSTSSYLILDLVPSDRIPQGEVAHKEYHKTISEHYQKFQLSPQSALPAMCGDGKHQGVRDRTRWINDVIGFTLVDPQSSSSFHFSANMDLGSLDQLLTRPNSLQGQSADPGTSYSGTSGGGGGGGGEEAGSPSCEGSSGGGVSTATGVDLPVAEVWATQVGTSNGEKAMLHPKWYLSEQLRHMIRKLEPLWPSRGLRIVHQPLSVIADLGIVTVNQMAEDARLIHLSQQQETARRSTIVNFGYGSAAATYQQALAKGLFGNGLEELALTSAESKVCSLPEEHTPSSENHKQHNSVLEYDDNMHRSTAHTSARLSPAHLGSEAHHMHLAPALSVDSESFSEGPYMEGKTSPRNYIARNALDDDSSENSVEDDPNNPLLHPDPTFVPESVADEDYVAPASSISSSESLSTGANPHLLDLTSYQALVADANISVADMGLLHPHSRSRVECPYFRILILYVSPCMDLVQWLISLGHSVAFMSYVPQILNVLRCGVGEYDVLCIEWNRKVVTQEVLDLLQKQLKDESFSTPIMYCMVEPGLNSESDPPPIPSETRPPLPLSVHPKFVMLGSTMMEATVSRRSFIRAEVRLGRILKDLRGDQTVVYQVTRRIGSGGFGDVYEVMFYASKGRLAMKRIPLGVITAGRLEYLYKEVAIMREMDHRNIVQLSHITCDKNFLSIFMELCECTMQDIMDAGFTEHHAPTGATLLRYLKPATSPGCWHQQPDTFGHKVQFQGSSSASYHSQPKLSSVIVPSKEHTASNSFLRVKAIYKEARETALKEQLLSVGPTQAFSVAFGESGQSLGSTANSRDQGNTTLPLSLYKSSPSTSSVPRTIYMIEVDVKSMTCQSSQHKLPSSLIELFESTFHRCGKKRITADDLLEHAIANDRTWLQKMFVEVQQLYLSVGLTKEREDEEKMENLSFSLEDSCSGSGDDALYRRIGLFAMIIEGTTDTFKLCDVYYYYYLFIYLFNLIVFFDCLFIYSLFGIRQRRKYLPPYLLDMITYPLTLWNPNRISPDI
eukprot:gene5737-4098_t